MRGVFWPSFGDDFREPLLAIERLLDEVSGRDLGPEDQAGWDAIRSEAQRAAAQSPVGAGVAASPRAWDRQYLWHRGRLRERRDLGG